MLLPLQHFNVMNVKRAPGGDLIGGSMITKFNHQKYGFIRYFVYVVLVMKSFHEVLTSNRNWVGAVYLLILLWLSLTDSGLQLYFVERKSKKTDPTHNPFLLPTISFIVVVLLFIYLYYGGHLFTILR